MRVTDILNARAKKDHLISFEVLPPRRGKCIKTLYRILDPLMDFKPPFIDVTYHREDFEYKATNSGYYEKIAVRKRPGTVGICSAIKHKYNVETVPHLICGGFSRCETESALIDLNFLGIHNVLALRGDPGRFDKKFVSKQGGHNLAIGLVNQIEAMNHGRYLDQQEVVNDLKTNFCVGVAGYPEKHFEAASYEDDLLNLKAKIDAGSDYVVTQMFFDNQRFFQFVKDCRDIGINVPIIPGIKPLTSVNQLKNIPANFYIDFPNDFVQEVKKCRSPADVRKLGIEWCIAQCKELFKGGVPCIHIYTMGDHKTVSEICSAVL